MEKIQATAVKYIKLGEGDEWEHECLTSGIIKFGYHKTPHQMCLEGKWEDVNKVWLEERKNNQSTATSDVRQIRTFYTATPDILFITFSQGYCIGASLPERSPNWMMAVGPAPR